MTTRETTTSTKTAAVDTVVAAVPLPSADLIIYRFDQIDAQLVSTNKKLDDMTNSYLTKEDAANLRAERLAQIKVIELRTEALEKEQKELVATDNRQQGAIDNARRVVGYAISVGSIVVGALALYLGLRK